MSKDKPKAVKLTAKDTRRARGGMRVQTQIKAGPIRSTPAGTFNFKVEIEGVTVG